MPGIQIGVGDKTPMVEIPVHPGALIRVKHSGRAVREMISLTSGGMTLELAASSTGRPAEFVAPVGKVQLRRGEDFIELDVAAGDELEVAFEE